MSVNVTPSDIITQAFQEIGVIVAGETISTAVQTDAFSVYKSLLSSLDNEGAMAITWRTASGTLTAATANYLAGVTGSGYPITTVVQPIRFVSWRCALGPIENAGSIVSLQALRDAAKNGTGKISSLPEVVAASVDSPDGNATSIYLWPTPATSGVILYVDYWGVGSVPANVSEVIAYPAGYQAMLVSNLALWLQPRYPRVGGIPEGLAAKAANSKQVIIQKNAAIQGLNVAPAGGQ